MATRVRLSDEQREWTAEISDDQVTLSTDPEPLVVHAEGDGRFRVESRTGRAVGVAAAHGGRVWVSVDAFLFEFQVSISMVPASRVSTARGPDALMSPMPATVVRIPVQPGDLVQPGDIVIVLEAMKMELPIRAPHPGVVGAIHCREGELVQPGKPLVEIVSPGLSPHSRD